MPGQLDSQAEFDPERRPVYLFTVPRFANPPSRPLLAGLLFPFVMLGYVAILVPRLLCVALLVILRFIRVVAYNSYIKAPPIIDLVLALPALLVFVVATVMGAPLAALLHFNLGLSGLDGMARRDYVEAVIGPVIGTQD